MANVGMSFEGNWAKVDFDDVTYGRTSPSGRATS